MSEPQAERREILIHRITTGLETLDEAMQRLRRTNAGLLISGIVGSGFSTLITAVTAAQGPVVGTGTEGWRLACSVAAVFSFAATVTVGVTQRLRIDERLAETTQCAGRLRALEVALATGTRSWDQVAEEYAEVVESYPDVIR